MVLNRQINIETGKKTKPTLELSLTSKTENDKYMPLMFVRIKLIFKFHCRVYGPSNEILTSYMNPKMLDFSFLTSSLSLRIVENL